MSTLLEKHIVELLQERNDKAISLLYDNYGDTLLGVAKKVVRSDDLAQDEVFGTIEAVKTVSDLFLPVADEVSEVNPNLEDNPESLNNDPYGDGWLVKINMSDASEVDSLLSAADYKTLIDQ